MSSQVKFARRILKRFGIYVYRTEFNGEEVLVNQINMRVIERAKGVLHIGANTGQERYVYAGLNDVKVNWLEASPIVYEELKANLKEFPHQIAYCQLLGRENVDDVNFYIGSNNGESSSIYDLGPASRLFDVEIVSKIQLNMRRLDWLFSPSDLKEFNHWVVDVQGSELEVLLGAGSLLKFCDSILVEVSTKDVYIGGALFDDVKELLVEFGLFPLWLPYEQFHGNIMFIRF